MKQNVRFVDLDSGVITNRCWRGQDQGEVGEGWFRRIRLELVGASPSVLLHDWLITVESHILSASKWLEEILTVAPQKEQ